MSNNDNVMARFLFAILQQKNLKDVSTLIFQVNFHQMSTSFRLENVPCHWPRCQIDWNEVARNPILAQEITNGHAARMRYSRFRSAMLGLEPQRRNRTTKEKPNRVTKSKKEPKDLKAKKEDSIKAETVASFGSTTNPTRPASSHAVKQESVPPSYDKERPAAAPMSTTQTASTHHTIQPRLLTPSSDTDGFAASSAVTCSPTVEMLNSPTPYDFPMGHFSHDPNMWSHAPMFPTYDTQYAFEATHMPFEHQNVHHHGDCSTTQMAGEPEGEHANVKHEDWDNLRL
jgi:hypothetical protein